MMHDYLKEFKEMTGRSSYILRTGLIFAFPILIDRKTTSPVIVSCRCNFRYQFISCTVM